jgi:hypothetical protein
MIAKSFERALKKGAIGEALIQSILEKRGWVVYKPITDGAHAFDMLSIRDKKAAVAIDVKTKPRLNKWNATGVNQSHFVEYQKFSQKHNMPFWIIFVDEGLRRIYGNDLEELEKPRRVDGFSFPAIMDWQPQVRIWSLESMKIIGGIKEDLAEEISSFSQRNYDFTPLSTCNPPPPAL